MNRCWRRLGGLLMGWGARLGFGCNIGAFVGGVASGSLHGWVWFPAALPGCLIGISLRPLFGLSSGVPACERLHLVVLLGVAAFSAIT